MRLPRKSSYPFSATFPDRLRAKYIKGSDQQCWEWTAAKNHAGYGVINTGQNKGRAVLAHRAHWILSFGAIPEDKDVLHRCDNPPCVNPHHLFIGDPMVNSLDKRSKNRANTGERHGLAKLTWLSVRAMRLARASDSVSYSKLGHRFGVTTAMAWNICNGRNWKELPA